MQMWIKTALFNFFIAAVFGVLMRFAFVEGTPTWTEYRYLLHAHSHVAMLGWVYLALYTLLVQVVLPESKKQSKFYGRLFWLTQLSVAGMMVAFPLEGYGHWGTAFSTLHILCSYIFAWRFWRDIKGLGKNRFSVYFLRTAPGFMVFSTLGVLAMPVFIIKNMVGTAVYYASVQFYLHFQLNGWFIFSALGLFFFFLEKNNIAINTKNQRYFFILLLVSCFLTYAIAVTWSTPLPFLFLTNSTGVLLQLAALLFFLLILRPLHIFKKISLPPFIRFLLLLALGAFILKILIQTAVVIPYIATVAYTIRNFVLGFLHLLLLGMMTIFLIALMAWYGLYSFKKSLAKYSLYILLAGIVLTEILLFGQGLLLWAGIGFIPKYYEVIFAASLLLPLGVGGMFVSQLYQPATIAD